MLWGWSADLEGGEGEGGADEGDDPEADDDGVLGGVGGASGGAEGGNPYSAHETLAISDTRCRAVGGCCHSNKGKILFPLTLLC